MNGVTPYWTGDEEWDVYEGEVALPRTGSDESVNGVARTSGLDDPDGPCVEDGHIYESAVYESVLHQTGLDIP